MTSYDAQIDVSGDVLGVTWTGSVWQSPTTGSQHAREWDALAVELYHYLAACGEDVTLYDDDSDATVIDGEYVRRHYDITRS